MGIVLFLLHIVVSVAHWLPTVLGYTFVFGKGKILHFGPLGVSVATGYAMYVTLMATNSWLLAIVAAAVLVTVISLVFAWLAVRLEPDAFGVIAIALHLSCIAVILNWTSLTRGPLGITGIPRLAVFGGVLNNPFVFASMTVVVAAGYYLLFRYAERSWIGRQLQALAEHPWYGQAVGVRILTVYVASFLLLAFAHIGGNFMLVQYLHFLHPQDYYFPAFIFLIMVVIAGGPGSMRGALWGCIAITFLKEGLRFIDLPHDMVGSVRLILFGLILFVAVWWRRDTLFPVQRSV